MYIKGLPLIFFYKNTKKQKIVKSSQSKLYSMQMLSLKNIKMTKSYLPNTYNTHTKHSTVRTKQRCIKDTDIQITIDYGDMILQKSDYIIYYFSNKVYDKLSKNKLLSKDLKSLVGMVVVMYNNLIITVYRSKDSKKFYKKYKNCDILYQY